MAAGSFNQDMWSFAEKAYRIVGSFWVTNMRIGRTLPPAAALISFRDLLNGICGKLNRSDEVARFQAELHNFFQVKHCFLLSSGKAALTLILRALNSITPGRNEVLIPAFTCYSVPSAVARAGLKGRISDIDPYTLDYKPSDLRRNAADTKRLLAIISPHLFGCPADVNMHQACLTDPEVCIIEDAAQGMGGIFNQSFLGTQTRVGIFSLGRGKAFSTVQGGIIVTDDDRLGADLGRAVEALKVQDCAQDVKSMVYAAVLSSFMHPSMFWIPRSVPGLRIGETRFTPQFHMQKFSTFQAGLAKNWTQRIAEMERPRARNTAFWKHRLSMFNWIEVIPSRCDRGSTPPLLRFPVLVKDDAKRKDILDRSRAEGLGIEPVYPDGVYAIQGFETVNGFKDFPGAQQCVKELITIPVHPYLTHKDRMNILNCFRKTDCPIG